MESSPAAEGTTIVLTLDVSDLDRMTEFWCGTLGYDRTGAIDQYVALRPQQGRVGPKLLLQRVPDRVGGRNRLHIDLDLAAGVALEAEVSRVVALGATPVGPATGELGGRWQVLEDPEGNVFCVVEAPSDA